MNRKWFLVAFLICFLLTLIWYFKVNAHSDNSQTTSYPSVNTLTQTNNLSCELVASDYITVIDDCEEKAVITSGLIATEEWLEEGARLTHGPGNENDPWESAKAKRKPMIVWSRNGDVISIHTDTLLDKVESNQTRTLFTVAKETSQGLSGALLDESPMSTQSASLYLDKARGLLSVSTVKPYRQLCGGENLVTESRVYSCVEK